MFSRTSPWLAVAVAIGCGSSSPTKPEPKPKAPAEAQGAPLPEITHGVAVGDVTHDGAVFWARADRAAVMHVRLDAATGKPVRGQMHARAEDDFTGRIEVDGLEPATEYVWSVWMMTNDGRAPQANRVVRGRVTTAPAPDDARPVTFAFGGDLAGQNVCRDAERGFPIFDVMAGRELDFWIALGDTIYADEVCEEKGHYGNEQVGGLARSADIESYWAHWKYNRQDETYRQLLAAVPTFAIWDDHESVNDVGPEHDTRENEPYDPDRHLLPLGLQAFLDYNPVAPPEGDPKRIYRRIRWGKQVELFVLDTRQYRDSNFAPDDGEEPKSMLGDEQRRWLEQGLADSDAAWKIVVSSVPISIPTGSERTGRDGWTGFDKPTGFERELRGIFEAARAGGIRDMLWITTDVHFAARFRYTPFEDDPSFRVHELVTGPLNARLFPNDAFAETFGTERLFFYGPEDPDGLAFDEAVRWFNFGEISIDADGTLELRVINARGEKVHAETLTANRAGPAQP